MDGPHIQFQIPKASLGVNSGQSKWSEIKNLNFSATYCIHVFVSENKIMNRPMSSQNASLDIT